MSGWPTITLEALAADEPNSFVDGPFGSDLKTSDYVEDGVPLIRIQNVKPNHFLLKEIRYISESKARQLARHQYRPGDLVITKLGDPCGVACLVPESAGTGIIVADIVRFRGDKRRVDHRYLSHFINSPTAASWVDREAKGTTRQRVNLSNFKGLPIPLPPLSEQRRIAETLDKADALRAKRRTTLAQLDTLTQSIFLEMFGDPAANPKGWPLRRIVDISQCLDRLRRPVTASDRKPGNVPYYGANGQQGWIDSALFDEPLVLVAEDGGYFDTPERGVAYRIDGPAWVNNHAHILRALPKHVETEFLHRALRHFNFLPYISGTTRAKLTQGQLTSVKLFVPPLQLQHDFVERVSGVQRIARTTARSGELLEALFASCQAHAFRDDLTASAVFAPKV